MQNQEAAQYLRTIADALDQLTPEQAELWTQPQFTLTTEDNDAFQALTTTLEEPLNLYRWVVTMSNEQRASVNAATYDRLYVSIAGPAMNDEQAKAERLTKEQAELKARLAEIEKELR